MNKLKSQEKICIKDDCKDLAFKTNDIKKIKIPKITNLINKIKPADPLINRKKILINPIKYPFVNKPVLKLPNFNHNVIPYNQKFEFFYNNNNRASRNNFNNSYTKDVHINNYINTGKMISRLIYARNLQNKEGNYSLDNIIDLMQINEAKRKRNIKLRNTFDKIENLNKLGISPEDIINFESNFECGNLQYVYLIYPQDEESTGNDSNIINTPIIHNYQLFLQNDINTNGHSQWFFFQVTNGKKGQKIKLNIMNFQRKKTKYSNGIKIWYYSQRKKDEQNIGWHHTEEKVEYSQNFLYNFNKGKRNYYYTLSFEYTIEYDNDEIYFANSIPFTYSDVIKDLNNYTIKENEKYNFFERKLLCTTITGNEVEYFNINNNMNILINDKNNNVGNKKGIILFARQHPGETVSNWILKGAYEYLMGFNNEANYLRDNFIFKIIPMINVDGVVCGNSRTSLAGCDLNRRWINPDELLHPEIYHLKELIFNFNKNVNVEYIIDFHGHFGTFNSFFYGNYDSNDKKYGKYFPFICGKISKIISFEKSIFKMPKFKKGTGRIHLFKELDIENIFTLETSYFGCDQGKYINNYFNIYMLKEIGRDICRGILLCDYNSNINQRIKEINSGMNDELKNEILNINKEFEKYIENLNNKTNKNDYNEDVKQELEKEQESENDIDVSDSESEPSRDNLNEEEIKKLFSFFNKKKIKKKKINATLRNHKFFKRSLIAKLKSKILDNEKSKTTAYPKASENFKPSTIRTNHKILTVNNTISNNINNINMKNSINELSTRTKNKNSNLYPIINRYSDTTNINNTIFKSYEEKQTQTEEKFFVYHWTYFFGLYKILTANYEAKKKTIGFPLLLKYDRLNYFKKIKLKSTGTNVTSPPKKLSIKDNDKNKTGRNNNMVKYIFKSAEEKTCYMDSVIIKNDYQKINTNIIENKNTNEKKDLSHNKIVNLKNKIKNRQNSIQTIISSFVSGCTSMKKTDFLRNYLNDEYRITGYQ